MGFETCLYSKSGILKIHIEKNKDSLDKQFARDMTEYLKCTQKCTLGHEGIFFSVYALSKYTKYIQQISTFY